jgi:apoptosis-inducing factor 3
MSSTVSSNIFPHSAGSARTVARLADLPDGSMRGIEVDGKQILLVRRGDAVFALDGTCSHAGAPLAEGVLDGDRVICPWHKAAFSIITGACVEPPAVDDLRHIPVGLRDGEVMVLANDILADEAPHPVPSLPGAPDRRCFAIIGGGAAGANAAQTLRAEGFAGRIVLIDGEGRLPYDRTLLSKSVLSGQKQGEKSPLHGDGFYRHQAIERWSRTVTALDPATRTIRFEDGEPLVYDAALIATGGEVIPPRIPGADLANVFLLRSPSDVDRIIEAAETGKRGVVIGASFIGMEVAASLRERGLDVTVVGTETEPFENQLGSRIGVLFRRLHESKGVAFRLGHKVERLVGPDTVEHVVLDDGTRLPADFVVVGLGVRPATGFVQDLAGRDLVDEDGALSVDGTLRLADGLYAAGDIASFPLFGDGPRIRVEHWRVAEQHGRLAARNMLGSGLRFEAVPYFWTIQYMNRLDYVGHAEGSDELVVRGDLEKPEFLGYYLNGGNVRAAIGWNRDQDVAALIALFERRRDWTVDQLHPQDSSPVEVLKALNRQ